MQTRIFYNFFIIFSLAGFLLSSFTPLLLNMQGSGINVIYRMLVLFFSIAIIMMSVFSNKFNYNILKEYFLFIVFWIIYSIFFLKDLYINPIKLASGKSFSEYIQFAFGVVAIPCCALMVLDYRKLDFKRILNIIYYIIFLLLFISLIFRSNSNVTGRAVGDIEIGVLVYGQYGTMLSLLSIYKLVMEKKGFFSLLYISGIILGTLIIFVSASRSPFIALILSTIYFFVLRNGTKGIVYLSIPACLLTVFFFQIVEFFGSIFKSNFLDRLSSTFEKDNEREKLFKVAANEFLDKPFFGNHFLIQTKPFVGSYPHNLFIEGFMAVGFFVGVILIILFIKAIFYTGRFVILKNNYTGWIPVLLCQFFIFSMFSNNIYSNNLLWYLLILTIIAFKHEKKHNYQHFTGTHSE